MEKSERAAVIPVEFGWSDVGSWNALEDIREKDDSGNVKCGDVLTLDSEGCILQGQDRLIAALGVKDLIVIDTPDALLVADKNRAQEVKKVFEQLKAEGRKEAIVPNTVQKPWGSYTILETGRGYLVKKIEVNARQSLSLQSHRHRSEHWTVVSGRAEVELDKKTFFFDRDQSICIPKGSQHRLSNPGEAPLILVEVQIGDTIDEEDIIRHEDKYGRS
jgi:mannose-1-phosphate guanylyltransferase/mannose-6-phosphate isomerase